MIIEKKQSNKQVNKININFRNDSPNCNNIGRFFIILCGVLSNVLFYTSTYKIEINNFMIIFSVFIVNVVFQYLLYKFYLHKKIVVSGVFLLIFVVVVMKITNIFYALNQIVTKINKDIKLANLGLQESLHNSTDLIMLFLVYIILVTMIITFIVNYRRNLILTILIMCPCLLGVVNGIMPSNIAFILYISFITSILAMNFSKLQNRRKKGKIDIVVSNTNIVNIGIITLIITLSVFLIMLVVYPSSEYKRSNRLNNIKENIEYFSENVSFSSFKNIFLNNIGRGGVCGGNLGNVDKLVYDNKPDLYVTITDYDYDYENIYLPAFRGNEYKVNRWSPINEDKISKELKYNVKNINYDACKALRYAGYLNDEYIDILKTDCYVENIGANKKFKYFPYNTLNEGNGRCGEYYISSDMIYGASSKFFNNYLENYNLYKNETVDDFLSYEKKYNKYVYEEYTKYPKGVISDVEYEIKGEYKGDNLFDCIEKVKNLCKKGTRYTLEPGKLPDGKDFVDYFYTETKKGYCSHYASTATIMLRMMGIPTRYVEGYVIRKENIEEGEKVEKGEMIDESTLMYMPIHIKEVNKDAEHSTKIKYRGIEFYICGYNDNYEVTDDCSLAEISGDTLFLGSYAYDISLVYTKDGVEYKLANNETLPEGVTDYKLCIEENIIKSYNKLLQNKSTHTHIEDRKKVTITDANAHAWVEVYVNNFGWVPVEVTPGAHYDDTKNEQVKEKRESNIDNNNNNNNIQANNPEKKLDNNKKSVDKSINIESKNSYIENRVYIKYIILLFIGLIFITALIGLRRIYILRNRKKKFILQDKRKSIINMYRYINNIFIYLGVEENFILSNSYKDKNNIHIPFDENKFSNVREIVLKAKYGNKDLQLEEYELVRNIILSESIEVYKSLGKIKKIEFKYFKCLI